MGGVAAAVSGWDVWALQATGGIREGLAKFPLIIVRLAPHPGGIALRDLVRWFPQSALRIASTDRLISSMPPAC